MTTFEIRVCDVCSTKSSVLGFLPARLEIDGWKRTVDGQDVCANCLWDDLDLLSRAALTPENVTQQSCPERET